MAASVRVERRSSSAVAPIIGWRRLVSSGAIVVLGTAVTNVCTFLFSFVAARKLAPEDYATVTACLSLLLVSTVPAATLQLIAARYTAIWWPDSPARVHALARWLSQAAIGIGVVAAAATIIFDQPLARYLHLTSTVPLVIFAGVLLCSFLAPVYRGVLQGQHRFVLFATATSSEYVTRLVVSVGLMVVGWRAAGALGGVLLGAGASACLAWWCARPRRLHAGDASIPWGKLLRWALPTLLVQAALNVLVYQDTLLAKHYFAPADAGLYAGLATSGRVLVYAAVALSTFLFPIIARTHERGQRSRLISNVTLGVVLAVEAIVLLMYCTDPAIVLRLLVGPQYLAVSALLPLVSIGLAAYAVINVLVSYLLATDNRVFWWPLATAPVAQAVLMATYHHSLAEFVRAFTGVMVVTLAVLLCIYLHPKTVIQAHGSDPDIMAV